MGNSSPYEHMAKVGGWGRFKKIVLPNTDEGHLIAGTIMMDNVPLQCVFIEEGMLIEEDFLYWNSDTYSISRVMRPSEVGVPVWMALIKLTCL